MSIKSPGIILVAMIGSVGALWISLIGLFVLAVTHDGAIATEVADSALKLVAAAITLFTGLSGVHVYVNRPQASAVTAGTTVNTISPGVVVATPASSPATQAQQP